MKIAVLGAGFTGLSAAYHLGKKGYDVTVFEKEEKPGGLAIGFKEKGWEWSLEKHYHHFFTNDYELITLAKELGLFSFLVFPASLTSLYLGSKLYPFNTPWQILAFKPVNFFNRLRLGFVTVLLKLLPMDLGIKLEKFTAFDFSQRLFGREVFNLIWKPLLESKFGPPAGGYADKVNASWLWARIKKRTLRLGYVKGGFQTLAEKLAQKIEEQGGKIVYNTIVSRVIPNESRRTSGRVEESYSKQVDKHHMGYHKYKVSCERSLYGVYPERSRGTRDDKNEMVFDAVISTLPTPIFTKLVPNLPKDYREKLNSIPHLHTLNLVLETKEPFLKDTYWLNINEPDFPFLCVVQHTNFIDKKYYGGNHILYISNYLPEGHPYFKKSAEELLEIYKPYLLKINPNYKQLSFPCKRESKNNHIDSRFRGNDNVDNNVDLKLFYGPFAQPVFLTNYTKIRPFGQVLPNLYFANLDSVYPWDRGTNYALEIGRKIAELTHLSLRGVPLSGTTKQSSYT